MSRAKPGLSDVAGPPRAQRTNISLFSELSTLRVSARKNILKWLNQHFKRKNLKATVFSSVAI